MHEVTEGTITQPGRLYIMQPFRHSCDRSNTRECECWLPADTAPRGVVWELSGVVRYRHVFGINRHERRRLQRTLLGHRERKLLKERV